MSSDDMSVLTTLLHNIKGISSVTGNAMELGFQDEDLEVDNA